MFKTVGYVKIYLKHLIEKIKWRFREDHNEITRPKFNQTTNDTVNAHLISRPNISLNHAKMIKMTVQTLTLNTHNSLFNHLENQIPGHRMK